MGGYFMSQVNSIYHPVGCKAPAHSSSTPLCHSLTEMTCLSVSPVS